jgi:transcriptional regulator with XRE-family HTH domain
LETLRNVRELAGYSQQELADESGVSQHTISEIELGRRQPQGRTLRKLAKALGVEVADLRGVLERPPLGPAPSSQQLTLNGELKEERRAAWESAVENARGLREGGQARMRELLSLWRASMERQEDADARREYRLEMADLLTQAHKAKTDLLRNFTGSSPEARRAKEEAKKAGAREVPNADWEEFLEADRFYYRLLGMLEGFELTVLTGDAAAAAEQATADEAAAEHVQSETTPHKVEELKVA